MIWFIIASFIMYSTFKETTVHGSFKVKHYHTHILTTAAMILFITSAPVISFFSALNVIVGYGFMMAVQLISSIVVYQMCKNETEKHRMRVQDLIYSRKIMSKPNDVVISTLATFNRGKDSIFTFICAMLALFGFKYVWEGAGDLTGLFQTIYTSQYFAGFIGIFVKFLSPFGGFIGWQLAGGVVLFIVFVKTTNASEWFEKKYTTEYEITSYYYTAKHENKYMNTLVFTIILNMIGSQIFAAFTQSNAFAAFLANIASSGMAAILFFFVFNIVMGNPSKKRFEEAKRNIILIRTAQYNNRVKELLLEFDSLAEMMNHPVPSNLEFIIDEGLNRIYAGTSQKEKLIEGGSSDWKKLTESIEKGGNNGKTQKLLH